MKKRALSLLLALVMVLTVLPVTALALEESEPNNTIPTAQEFEICDTINGSISEKKGVDWYKFTIEESGNISLKLTSFMQWYTISLFDAEGTSLWVYGGYEWDATAGMRTDSYTSDLIAGTYYIRITGDQYLNLDRGHATGDYILKTDYVNANATETEVNNNIANANDLPLYGSVNGQIAINDNCDFFQITLPASGLLTINLTAKMPWASVALYNEDGNCIWLDDHNNWDSSALVQHLSFSMHLIPGKYYIKVTGDEYLNLDRAHTTGTYTLGVDYVNANANEIEPNNSTATAQWIIPNKQISGQIAMNDSMDFFQFTLAKDMELTIDFTSYMQYYALQVYNEAGDRIWYDDSNGWDASSKSRHDLFKVTLTAGTYVMCVTSDESVTYDRGHSTGNYTFKLNTENPFSDVPTGSFYYDPVLWALENGITTGATATTFDPNGSCLRAHVVTFLHRAAGNPAPTAANNPFTDVKTSDFFYKPVLWAVEKGITNGVSATEFGSFANCNRAAVVTFLWRAAGQPEPASTENPFTDVKTGDFFYKAVLWAVENGITNGVDATHFGPTAACNRAQVVTFLYRAYN